MITIFDAPEPPRRRLRKSRPKPVDPEATPTPVPVTLLTAVRTEALGDEGAAQAWLQTVAEDEDSRDAEIATALVLINAAVHAHRVASLDGHLPDISTTHALTVRIGYGDGEGLADGKWEKAIELARGARRKRTELLAPQEKVAAILGGRETLDAATGAILRARVDLDSGRARDAALQLRMGLEAILADHESFGKSGQEEDLAALKERRRAVGEIAGEALAGPLGPGRVEALGETLGLCERVLRRRRAYG